MSDVGSDFTLSMPRFDHLRWGRCHRRRLTMNRLMLSTESFRNHNWGYST
jgi:hypothetical protein